MTGDHVEALLSDTSEALARMMDYAFELEVALIRCAEIAGEDGEAIAAARSGAMKHPALAVWAMRAVQQLRDTWEDELRE